MITDYQRKTIERAARYIENSVRESGAPVTSPAASVKLLRATIWAHGPHREHFAIAFLDAQHRLIEARVMFSGTLDGAAVYPRQIAREALMLDAHAVVLAHNHPSGCTRPSGADRTITQKIRDGLALLDIRTLDHVILTARKHYSFAEHGDI